MNASFWDPVIVRQLRWQLFAEHIGQTTEDLGAAAAHRRFGQVARQNLCGDAGATWQGLAFSLDPADYARQRFVS